MYLKIYIVKEMKIQNLESDYFILTFILYKIEKTKKNLIKAVLIFEPSSI